jgi:hypothetical protein
MSIRLESVKQLRSADDGKVNQQGLPGMTGAYIAGAESFLVSGATKGIQGRTLDP